MTNLYNIVYISNSPKKGYQKIITEYTILNKNIEDNTSELDINLHTGRTYQIGAHDAGILNYLNGVEIGI